MPMRKDAWWGMGEKQEFDLACSDLVQRHRYEDDPVEAIEDHRKLGCRWWHAGRLLVHGPDFHPEQIRQEREGRCSSD